MFCFVFVVVLLHIVVSLLGLAKNQENMHHFMPKQANVQLPFAYLPIIHQQFVLQDFPT